jgi:hypothetical protein
LLLAFLCWWFLNGLQYFYFGQVVKGVILALIDMGFWVLTVIFCGLPALIWIPWRVLWLIDTVAIHRRLQKGPVSQWRCF